MLIGYTRVSTHEQTVHLQQDALRKIGCTKIFTDTITGSTFERKGLDEALAYVREGDTLVVWRLDRLGRSLRDLIDTVTRLNNRQIEFRSLTGTIGWVFMLGGLVAVGCAPLGGILSDRWGKRAVSIASNVLLALAVVLIPFFSWGVWLLVVFGATSLGAAFRQGPLTALMTELVPSAQRGSFIALRNISSQFGIGAAAFVGGVLYQQYGYGAVTTLCAAMTGLAALLLATHIVEPQTFEERV